MRLKSGETEIFCALKIWVATYKFFQRIILIYLIKALNLIVLHTTRIIKNQA